MTIKAVAFDMGGVLTKCPMAMLKGLLLLFVCFFLSYVSVILTVINTKAIHHAEYETGLQLPDGVTFDLILNNKGLRLAFDQLQEGKMIIREFESLLSNALCEKYPDKKCCKFQPFTNQMEIISKDLMNESMSKTVSFLKNRGFKTAMLTNNFFVNEQRTEAFDDWFALLPMDKFDVVIESCKVGICKPKKEIFELLLKELGVAPPECIFIDDFSWNLGEAKKMGIQCIHMKDTIATLKQLEALLQLSSGTLTEL